MSDTTYQRCIRRARNGYGCTTEDEVQRVANHLYAKALVGGATLARVEGKSVKQPREADPPRPQQP